MILNCALYNLCLPGLEGVVLVSRFGFKAWVAGLKLKIPDVRQAFFFFKSFGLQELG